MAHSVMALLGAERVEKCLMTAGKAACRGVFSAAGAAPVKEGE